MPPELGAFFNGLFVLNCEPKEVLRRIDSDTLNAKKD